MRRICFLGTASHSIEQDQILGMRDTLPADAEIWVVNEAHTGLPEGRKPSRVFQMHVRDWRESERRYLNGGRLPKGRHHNCFGRDRAHVEYLRTCGVPVYCQRQWPDIPTCVVYPFDRVRDAVGIPLPPYAIERLWATSSFGYMAALLLAEHLQAVAGDADVLRSLDRPVDRRDSQAVEELILLGVELPIGTMRERLWEWPNLAYYLGMMRGMGIDVNLPRQGSSLLSAPHYAIDGHPHAGEADHWWVPGHAGVIYDEGDSCYRLGNAAHAYHA